MSSCDHNMSIIFHPYINGLYRITQMNLNLPALGGRLIFQLSDKKLGYGCETVTHTVDVSALDTQDIGESICDMLDLQQKDVVE